MAAAISVAGPPGTAPSPEGSTQGPTSGLGRLPEEELPVLDPAEVRNRLERSDRQFRNRRKILIRGLPPDVTNQEVHELLSDYELKYCFVDKFKGTAFITLQSSSQAASAVGRFHGSRVRGGEISAQLQAPDSLLCISNLPRLYSQQQFQELLRPFGSLERCFLVYSSRTGHSKGYGFVEFMRKDSAARARSELLGKQVGGRRLHVHWSDGKQLSPELLHSKCLCLEKLPHNYGDLQEIRRVCSKPCPPTFCQVAYGQDGQPGGFAVLEYESAEVAELAQESCDGSVLGGNRVRLSFCAPGAPGRSALAALVAAHATALNRGKGLLPEPSILQILSSLGNPTALQLLLTPLLHGNAGKQGLLGAAPSVPLVPGPALPSVLLQMALQSQQKPGILGDLPLSSLPPSALGLAATPAQPPSQLLGELSSVLQGLSSSILGSLSSSLRNPKQSENGAPSPGVSLLGEPPKDWKLPLNPFLNLQSLLPAASRGGAANKGLNGKSSSILGGAGGGSNPPPPPPPRSCLADPPPAPQLRPPPGLPRDTFPFEFQTDLSSQLFPPTAEPPGPLLGGFSPSRAKLSSPSGLERGALGTPLPPPPFYSGSPSSYFTSGVQAGLKQSHLSKALGLPPPASPAAALTSAPSLSHSKTQKRSFSHLLPSPEPSPEGCYVGQHSQGLGGHYADSYLKRKRIF